MRHRTVIKSLGIILLTAGLQAMVAMDEQYPHAELIEGAINRAFDEKRGPYDRLLALNILVVQNQHLEEQARARILLARWYWAGTHVTQSISDAARLLDPIAHMPVADKYKNEAISLYTQLTGNYSAMVDRYYRETGRKSPSGHRSPAHEQRKNS